MNLTIKSLLFFLLFLKFLIPVYSQIDKYEKYKYDKKTIYLNYNNEIKNCKYKTIKYKQKKKEGIQFNLCGKAILLSPVNVKPDTLCLWHKTDYQISTTQDIERLVKEFRFNTWKKKPHSKKDKLFQFYDRNDIFKTYLIEIINNEKFVIYPVKWRNEGAID